MRQSKILRGSRISKVILAVIAWSLGICVPLFIRDPFFLHVCNLIFVGSVLALSWSILARTGYVSFAHNAFIGIGAYTSVYLVMQLDLPYWVGLLAAGGMAGVFALVLGVIILRLQGIFFVLSTFCFAQIMLRVFRLAAPITGGANGITDIPPPIFPLVGTVQSHGQFYVLFYIFATLVVIFTVRVFNSSTGRKFKAIGEDIFTAESMGIYTTREKILAFIFSSAIAGLSGSIYAHYSRFISDTTFAMAKSIEVVIYSVVGGMGTIVGPIIGAGVMIPIPEFLRGFVAYQIALYGLILILILRFFPAGIWGTIKRVAQSMVHEEDFMKLKSLRMSSEIKKGFSMDFARSSDEAYDQILEIQNVDKNFGGLAALSGISCSVRKGDILGIVGPNGAGKSTFFNVISGIFSPDRGRVLFEGRQISGLRPSKINQIGIARVFQATVLYSEATVRENVARSLVARAGFSGVKDLFGMEKKKHLWVSEQTQEVLSVCGLGAVVEEVARNLPYGFQRLLGLAMALASRPRLLLLDEPVAGMSIEEMDVIADLLKQLHRLGLSMILVEHNVNFIMRLCPRIIVLDYGKKIAEGTPKEIRRNPAVIEAFLGG